MAWANSKIFQEWVKNPLFNGSGGTPPTLYTGFLTDTIKCALFAAGITPDRNASLATSGYNSAASQWVVANEKTGGTDWVAGGRALASKTNAASAGTITLDAADLTSVATATMASVEGCLIYDDTITGGTIADQGLCFNWFGGPQSVTAGTFSVVFNASGIMNVVV
jgi:hypothetical protein